MTLYVWFLVALAMLFYVAGDYVAKLFANEPSKGKFFLGWALYSLNTAIFFPALHRFNSLSKLTVIWGVGYVVVTIALAVIVFKEPLEVRHWIGIIFGTVAVYLLST